MRDTDPLYLLDLSPNTSPLDVQSTLTKAFGTNVAINQTSREVLFRTDAATRLRQLGPSKVLAQAGMLTEALLKPGAPSVIGSLINSMLRQIAGTARELVIVDPYFLVTNNKTPANYPDIIDSLWEGVIESADSVVIVTLPKVDATVRADITAKVTARSPNARLTYQTSDDFHDRFWIVDRKAGLVVGTSANSLGNKYALADFMQATDVSDLVNELATLGLI